MMSRRRSSGRLEVVANEASSMVARTSGERDDGSRDLSTLLKMALEAEVRRLGLETGLWKECSSLSHLLGQKLRL